MRCSPEAGFSLLDVVVALGIAAALTLGLSHFMLASRPAEVAMATTQFDALLDAARAVAADSGDGATVYILPVGDGFSATVYARRPASATPPAPDSVPILRARTAVAETATGQQPPLALVIHAGGQLGLLPDAVPGTLPAVSELDCPAAGAFRFTFSYGGEVQTRSLPCHTTPIAAGPAALVPPPSPVPTPTAMGGCPAGLTFTNGVCADALPAIVAALAVACPAGYAPSGPAQCSLLATRGSQCAPGYTGTYPSCVHVPQTKPPPCTPDSYGFCIAGVQRKLSIQRCTESTNSEGGVTTVFLSVGSNDFTIYDASTLNSQQYTQTISVDPNAGVCSTSTTWNPDEPALVTGDPGLP